jgi:preprotein translocase SecF subunit
MILALVLLGTSWIFFGMNVRLSSEFTGGVKMSVQETLDTTKINQDLERYLNEQWFQWSRVESNTDEGITTIVVKTQIKDDEKVSHLSEQIQLFLLEDQYISSAEEILDSAITGPSVGSYMKRTALISLILGIVIMAVFMIFSFSGVRNYISPGILALITILTMIFDVSIPLWAYGLWMMVNSTVQVDTVFIIAILTTIWYSINDTIIIFDRVRENMQNASKKDGNKLFFGKIFEDSLWQTMRRSFGTSISTLLVVISMFIFGTGVIKTFSFTIGIGVIAGTFSSIFIAAPLAYLMLWKFKHERKMLEHME